MNHRESIQCTRRQRGAIGVMMPFVMIMTLSFGALAIDIAHMVVVRNELQNAADAAALAGAAGLWPINPTPNWSNAVTKGTSAISLNRAGGALLSTGNVQAGYWNPNPGTSPSGLQPQGTTPTTGLVPAVQVTIQRSGTSNGGPVVTYLASFFGVTAATATATAVAVVAPPGSVLPGATPLPFVISSCLYNQLFNPTTGQPNSSISFQIGSSYHYNGCETGQWTSYFTGSNSDAVTKNYIDGVTPSPAMSIGDNVWIQTGTKTNLFSEIASKLVGQTVLIPVVNDPTGSGFTTNGQMPIVAFAAFYIEAAAGGSGKYVQGHFVGNYKFANTGGGIGPYYGGYVPPRLAQ